MDGGGEAGGRGAAGARGVVGGPAEHAADAGVDGDDLEVGALGLDEAVAAVVDEAELADVLAVGGVDVGGLVQAVLPPPAGDGLLPLDRAFGSPPSPRGDGGDERLEQEIDMGSHLQQVAVKFEKSSGESCSKDTSKAQIYKG